MTGLTPIGWYVPDHQRESFIDWVEEKHGRTDRYVGFEVEEAMREWLDEDDGKIVELQVKELCRRAGVTFGVLGEKKNSDSKTKMMNRINPELKDRFAKRVDKHNRESEEAAAKLHLGEALGRALGARARGGRWNRIEHNLEDLTEQAGAFLAELNDESEAGLSTKEKRTVAMASLIDGGEAGHIPVTELDAAIAEVQSDSDYALEEYRPRVADHLDVVRVGERSIYSPKENIAETVDDIDAELGESFTPTDLEETIADEVGSGYVERPTVEWFIDHITDSLNLTEHPNNSSLLVRAADVEAIREQPDDEELSPAQVEADAELDALLATDGGN